LHSWSDYSPTLRGSTPDSYKDYYSGEACLISGSTSFYLKIGNVESSSKFWG